MCGPGQHLHAAVHGGADRREAMFVDGAEARLRVGSTAAPSYGQGLTRAPQLFMAI